MTEEAIIEIIHWNQKWLGRKVSKITIPWSPWLSLRDTVCSQLRYGTKLTDRMRCEIKKITILDVEVWPGTARIEIETVEEDRD